MNTNFEPQWPGENQIVGMSSTKAWNTTADGRCAPHAKTVLAPSSRCDSFVAAACDRRTAALAERRCNPNVPRVARPPQHYCGGSTDLRSKARLCEAERRRAGLYEILLESVQVPHNQQK